MKKLWTFEKKEKLEAFAEVLRNHDILFESVSAKNEDAKRGEVSIFVDDDDFPLAKKLFMKHRKRRTSSDLL